MVGLILISPEILKLLAPSAYWKGIILIPPLVLSNFVIFAYTMYVNIEYYYEKTIVITVNTIIAAGMNIVLNGLYIPKFGYTAAAYTTLFSYAVSFALHHSVCHQVNIISGNAIYLIIFIFIYFFRNPGNRILSISLSGRG